MIPHWVIDVLGYLMLASLIFTVFLGAIAFWIDKRKPPRNGGYES
jgi:hypothetical protein